MMISIEATKKGRLSVEHEKRKHWLVTKIRNVSGCDDAIDALCSRISKRLGAQARAVREGKGEKVIEIQGKHEETRVEEVLARENVKIVGLRRKVEVCTKARRGRAKRTSETETREQEVLGHKNRVNQRFGQERWRKGQWRRSGETRGRVAGETVERDE